jgi:hypothetical protein
LITQWLLNLKIGAGGRKSPAVNQDEENESKIRPRNYSLDHGRTADLNVRQPNLQSALLRQRRPVGE